MVSFHLESLSLWASFTFGQEPNPVGSLLVIDAMGKRVGTTTSIYGLPEPAPYVIFELDGRFFPLKVAQDRFFGHKFNLYYQSSDCTGIPYFDFFELRSSPLPNTSVHGPNWTLWTPDPEATPETILVGSTIDSTNECSSRSGEDYAIRAIPLIALAEHFTAPFHVVAETVITLASPDNSPSGTRIKLVGKGFSVGTVEVTFNGVSGLDVEVINDTTLLVTVPSLPIGPVDITVTTAGGTATLPGGPGGFTVSALTAAIPTLLEWGTILLMTGLVGAGIHHLIRKRTIP
jgi:hypothetical protein